VKYRTNFQTILEDARLLVTKNLLLSLLLLLAGYCGYASAQDNVGDDSTVIYPASYFADYRPVTAQDMLNRIPGMSGSGGSSRGPSRGGSASRGGRGFGGGSGNQILINGKRVAGKNNNSQDLLRRISSEQVLQIEIIRGTSGELDVRGSSQIINVVLFEEMSNTSISFQANMDQYSDSESKPGGSLSYSGRSGALNYLINASAEPRYQHRVSTEHSILGDFSPNDLVLENRITQQTDYSLSTNLGYDISANSSIRFNALFQQKDNPTDVFRETTDLTNGSDSVYREQEIIPGAQDNWEIGGDYEYKFADGSRFKALFISNETDMATNRERFEVLSDGSLNKNLYLDASSTLQERILRTSYTRNFFESQNVEIGIERAQTILGSKLRLGIESASGTPSPEFGGLVPIAVANANSQVEEIRYEPFAIHNWKINQKMTLETSLVYETSEITQTGDFRNQRNFEFFKPKLDYRYDLTPSIQIRAVVEKFVRQLSFADFVAATENEDTDSNTQAGNVNLSPEYWWNYNLLAEYRLPNDAGVLSANLYKHAHRDKNERIDVSTSEDDLRSAVGNIGNGDMWVFEVKSSIRLGMLNLPNVLVTTRANVKDSKIKDPFLGIERRFSNFDRGSFGFGFRHDIPEWRLNYGVNWMNRFDGGIKRYDIDDIESTSGDPFTMAFVEVIAFGDITFRLDGRNVTEGQMCRQRQRYVGRASAGILEEIEYMCSGSGAVYSLKVSGRF
jgi:hypothetical protein